MARSQSVFLTAVVAMVLGIVIGVVGLAAVMGAVNVSADNAAGQQDATQGPQLYGKN